MRKIETCLCLVFLFGATGARAEKSTIAVFGVQDANAKGVLGAQALEQLTARLVSKLSGGEGYKVVPRSEGVAGGRPCLDDRCRLELGRALSAAKSLSTQLGRQGERCFFTGTLFDVRTASSARAQTAPAPCDEASLGRAVDVLADLLLALPKRAPGLAAPTAGASESSRSSTASPDAGTGSQEAVAGVEKARLVDAVRPPPLTDATARFLKTPDGRACAGGDGDACTRVASLEGSTRVGWRHADHGCQMIHTSSCQWATKIAYELGEKARARSYAKYACSLGDLGGCSWYAKIEHEIGSKSRALEVASTSCRTHGHGPSCAWAANFAYSAGNRTAAMDFGRRGCQANDGESCGWGIKLDYEAKRFDRALSEAWRSCDTLKHGASCTWSATIDYEGGNAPRAFDYALKGCALNDAAACEWATKLGYELGQKDRALEAGLRACQELRDGVACSWAALIDYEVGNKSRALDSALRGCALLDPDACEMQRRIEGESAPSPL